ncbi:MAG: hydrogenase maturation nickel metallochaperone HypA [Nitrospirae bacterium]|jgi:hydrogenase nickel incorporation protein HypA/HybF|nr:hydrogenase maturation nickel metallochaperone HypA [Nitrospirota bacterium]
MHELSLVMSLLELCEDEASRGGFERIDRIVLEVGALSGVSVPALTFSFESAVLGTVSEFAELEIREIPGTGWCFHCEKTVSLQDPLRSCPGCGGSGVLPTGGMEFRLCELIVRDDRSGKIPEKGGD